MITSFSFSVSRTTDQHGATNVCQSRIITTAASVIIDIIHIIISWSSKFNLKCTATTRGWQFSFLWRVVLVGCFDYFQVADAMA